MVNGSVKSYLWYYASCVAARFKTITRMIVRAAHNNAMRGTSFVIQIEFERFHRSGVGIIKVYRVAAAGEYFPAAPTPGSLSRVYIKRQLPDGSDNTLLQKRTGKYGSTVSRPSTGWSDGSPPVKRHFVWSTRPHSGDL